MSLATKRSLLAWATGFDPRVVVLFIAVAVAFMAGIRWDAIKVERAEHALTQYKLAAEEERNKLLVAQSKASADAASRVRSVSDEAAKERAALLADNQRLVDRFNAERMRRATAERALRHAGGAAPARIDEQAAPEPDLWGAAGAEAISIANEADQLVVDYKECRAYANVLLDLIQNGGSQSSGAGSP